ncbi:MAG: histidine phosphatase family protein [Cellvibrionaceae bacterium]
MSELYLVRHGQASFDSDDYDKLSPVGHEQAGILADYWASIDNKFDAIYSGSLRRQLETSLGLSKQVHLSEPTVLEGLNEYASHAVLEAYREQYAESEGFSLSGNMKDRKFFQQFLEAACLRWVKAELEGSAIEPFSSFKSRVQEALKEIMMANPKGRRVVVSTSGGVIAMAVQAVLGIPDEQAINLNWMVFNTSITRIPYSGSKRSLSVFNAIPHLEREGFTDKITYR